MALRLGPTTKKWQLDDYMENENAGGSGHSTAATGSDVKRERGQDRRHVKHQKHSHSRIPLGFGGKEESTTGHKQENERPPSPHQQTSRTEVNKGKGLVRSTLALIRPYNHQEAVTSVFSVILLPIVIIVCLVSIFGDKTSIRDAQPLSPLRSVFQSQDLAVTKSHVDGIWFTLNRLPSSLALDGADGKIPFDETRFAINDVALKVSQGIHQVDLLGSLIGRELSPAIKASSHVDNCSLIVESIHPIAQTAQVRFHTTLDSFDEILSSCDNTMATLRASQSGIQQALDHADKQLRSWNQIWTQEGKEAGPKRKREYEEMQTWQGILSDAVRNLSSGREIVNLKISRYTRSSAEFDTLVQGLDTMARTEGPSQSHCGIAEAEMIERQLKSTVAQASSDGQGIESFEEYYRAI